MEFSYVVDTGLTWPNGRTKRTQTDHIQVHHTVGNYGTPARWKSLHESKIKDGHKGVGYSYLICKDGTIYLGRGLEYAHGGVKDSKTNNANQRSVAIAFDGDMRDESLPTGAQLSSFVRLCLDVMQHYDLGTGAVLGHNEIPVYSGGKPTGGTYATLCPCIDMDELRRLLRESLTSEKEEKPFDFSTPADEEITEDAPAYPALYRYTGATYVNLRAGASTGYQAIGKVSKGDKVIVLGTSGDWAEVIKHEGTPMLRGWCLGKYLEEV